MSIWSLLSWFALVIGLLSNCLLKYGKPRPWKLHVGSFGVGASLGGLISVIAMHHYEMDYLDSIYAFLAAAGLDGLIRALSRSATDSLLITMALLAGPVVGGTVMWFIYNRRKQKDDETV